MATRSMRAVWIAVLTLLAPGLAGPAASAELEPRTLQAYEDYVQRAMEAFLNRAGRDGALLAPVAHSVTRPAAALDAMQSFDQGRIVKVPRGLVHHWGGTIVIPGVTLDQVLSVAQAYDRYAAVYRPIVSSRLLARDHNTFRIAARVREESGILSAVLEIRTMVTYERTGACAHSLAASTEIREVRNAGESNEHLLPPGRDSGYLWRANTFTRFVERDGNVYVELETIGLTRAFPKLFGWIIEPIARRIGRNSVERTLTEFRAAVHASVPETVSGVAAGPRISARGRVESPTRRASGFAAHGSMASHAHGKTGGLLARHSPQKLARKAGV